MGRMTPSPQIQQLKAANAGDIAFADGGILQIGVLKSVLAATLFEQAKSMIAVDSNVAPTIFDNGTHALGVAFTHNVTLLATESISFSAVDSIESLVGMPTESPVIGVVPVIVSVS
jgi:hypothetical protein